MAKAYTDLEQSKMLAEFLPLDSADMRYAPFGDTHPWFIEDSLIEKDSIPCWSLDALLNVLPKPAKRIYELNIYSGDEKPFFGFNDCDMNIHKGFEGDNYVDACVNMIVYMHEKLNDF